MGVYSERSRTVVHVVRFDAAEVAQIAGIELARLPETPNVRWVDGAVEVSWPESLEPSMQERLL